MPLISYRANGFQPPYEKVNTAPMDYACSGVDIFRMAVVNKIQITSFRDRWRASPTRAVLDTALDPAVFVYSHVTTQAGRLAAHGNFWQLTPTEKNQVSRQLAECFSRFYAQRILDVARLYVVESTRVQGIASVRMLTNGTKLPKQPDMIGQSRDLAWHVVEAKGRSNSSGIDAAIRDGKVQAKNIRDINLAKPSTRSVVATLVDRAGFVSVMVDPPAERSDLAIELDVTKAAQAYYLDAREISRDNLRTTRVDGQDYVFLPSKNHKLEFGIASELFYGSHSEHVLDDLRNSYSGYRYRDSDRYSLGTDGYAARLAV